MKSAKNCIDIFQKISMLVSNILKIAMKVLRRRAPYFHIYKNVHGVFPIVARLFNDTTALIWKIV